MPTYNDSKDMRLRAILLQFVVPGVLVLASTRADAFCYREAGNKYGIDPDMLESIALTESSFRPNIESHTADIGFMATRTSQKIRFNRSRCMESMHKCTHWCMDIGK